MRVYTALRTGVPRVEYQETYAEMSDDEILSVASDLASLEEHALVALTVELNRRQLSEPDIIQYRQRVAAFKPEDFWGRDEHIARSVNGCGTGLYGKREFEQDGSFVTTKWFMAFFVPLIPLASMRVKVVEHGYLVRLQRPCLKQVAYVYSYLLLLLLATASVEYLPIAAAAVLIGAILPLPWLLRRLARDGVVRPPRPL
jgi:hypothetical protein